MRTVKWAIPAIGLLLLLAAAPLRAAPPPTYDVVHIVDASRVIVVGRVVRLTATGTVPRDVQRITIAVDQVLKGDISRGARIRAVLWRADGILGVVNARQYAMFFLKPRAAGTDFEATDTAYPAIAASPEYAGRKPMDADPLAAVATELTWVLATPWRLLIDPATGVHEDLMRSVDDSDPGGRVVKAAPSHWIAPPRSWQGQQIYAEAAYALERMPYDVMKAPLAEVVRSRQVSSRLWAVATQLNFGDASGLPSIVPLLVASDRATRFAAANLSDMIGRLRPAPDNLPALAALLRSNVVSLRRAAAEILSRSGPTAMRPLAAALGDPDPEVRFLAVDGLAAATGERPRPRPEEFRRDEAAQIRFWTEWTRENIQ